MKTIGIISDTHGTLSHLAKAALAGCDHIIHAGDIGDAAVLSELREICPVTAVLGNTDWPEYGDNVRRTALLEIEGVFFQVAHIPRTARDCSRTEPVPDVCIHGHTHVPLIESGDSARPAKAVVCPGSPASPRNGFPSTIAKMVVRNGHIEWVNVETLRGDPVLSWTPKLEQ